MSSLKKPNRPPPLSQRQLAHPGSCCGQRCFSYGHPPQTPLSSAPPRSPIITAGQPCKKSAPLPNSKKSATPSHAIKTPISATNNSASSSPWPPSNNPTLKRRELRHPAPPQPRNPLPLCQYFAFPCPTSTTRTCPNPAVQQLQLATNREQHFHANPRPAKRQRHQQNKELRPSLS